MRNYLLILFFITVSLNAFTQNESLKIDSLKKVLAIEKSDTLRIDILRQISFFYVDTDPKKALQYQNEAIHVASKINSKQRIANCYLSIGDILYNLDDKVGTIQNYYKALQIFQSENFKYASAYVLAQIGFTEITQQNFTATYDACAKGLDLLRAADSVNTAVGALCYVYMGRALVKQNKINEAFLDDSMGLEISLAVKNVTFQATAHSCLGDILTQQWLQANNQADKSLLLKAKNSYLQSLIDFKMIGDIYGGAGDEYSNLALTDIYLHDLIEAQRYADSALQCAKAINYKDNFRESYFVQMQIDSAQRNFSGAFDNYKKYIIYRDSITNDINAKKILRSSLQYEFDKKEAIAKATQAKKDADAKRVKNQQYFAIAALGIVVLAVVIIALIQFRNNKQKQKANKILQTTLTDLKSTQQQLIQSEKMASLGELTAGIAHEIQNPLNFVNNFSEVNQELIEELKIKNEQLKIADEEVKELVNDIQQNLEKINHHGKRADAIVKGMLQHSRKNSGQKEPADINALCDEYLRLSFHGMRAKDKNFNADFKTDFDETIGKLNIVPQDMGRVLLNLCNNAFYAVNEKLTANRLPFTDNYKPLVSVTTKKINDKVEIVVRDNGNGIPQNIIDKIFQPFFTTKPTGQGTGLGLSLAYDIITKEHNGTIKVESKASEGSKFTIQLPIIA